MDLHDKQTNTNGSCNESDDKNNEKIFGDDTRHNVPSLTSFGIGQCSPIRVHEYVISAGKKSIGWRAAGDAERSNRESLTQGASGKENSISGSLAIERPGDDFTKG